MRPFCVTLNKLNILNLPQPLLTSIRANGRRGGCQSQCNRDVMFDRVCPLTGAAQLSLSSVTHTKTWQNSKKRALTQIDKNLTHKHRHIRCRGMKCVSLVTVLWEKKNRLENHRHIPSHPEAPRPSPSLSPIYGPIFSANCSSTPSLHYWTTFPASLSPLPQQSSRPTPSLPPSLSLELSIWSRLPFILLPQPGSGSEREKRNERKCLRRPNLYLAKDLHGSMTP